MTLQPTASEFNRAGGTNKHAPLHVFLSGRIDGVSLDAASSWRRQAARMLEPRGCCLYDPTRVIVAAKGNYQARPNEVFTNDHRQLLRTDVLLVNLDLPPQIASHDAPFFTIGEMFLAHARGLPVITFGACFRGRAGYEAVVTRSFDHLAEAVDYILLHYLPVTSPDTLSDKTPSQADMQPEASPEFTTTFTPEITT